MNQLIAKTRWPPFGPVTKIFYAQTLSNAQNFTAPQNLQTFTNHQRRSFQTTTFLLNTSKLNVIPALQSRGLLSEWFPPAAGLDHSIELLQSQPQLIYAGFDATGPALHVGHLLVIIGLLHFARASHRVAFVLGGGTAMIGDPSGRLRERTNTSRLETVQENSRLLEGSLRRIWKNHREHLYAANSSKFQDPLFLNNYSWYRNMNVIDFMTQSARQVRLSRMLSRKIVQDRLQVHHTPEGNEIPAEGLNMAEFNYQLFQAYDWWHLYNQYGCRFQLGGSDQLGNIATGAEYIQRIAGTQVYGYTLPLVTDESGNKFGKSTSATTSTSSTEKSDGPKRSKTSEKSSSTSPEKSDGSKTSDRSSPSPSSGPAEGNSGIWLSPDRTTPFQLYQFFMRIPDSRVQQLLKRFTFYPDLELENLFQIHLRSVGRLATDQWYLQKKLAKQAVLLVHGQAGLDSAVRVTDLLYGGSPSRRKVSALSAEEFGDMFAESPSLAVGLSDPEDSLPLTLLDVCGKLKIFASSRSAAKTIAQGGMYVNFERVTDPAYVLDPARDVIGPHGVTILRRGKRDYYILRWS